MDWFIIIYVLVSLLFGAIYAIVGYALTDLISIVIECKNITYILMWIFWPVTLVLLFAFVILSVFLLVALVSLFVLYIGFKILFDIFTGKGIDWSKKISDFIKF